jgi:hypothetical protein
VKRIVFLFLPRSFVLGLLLSVTLSQFPIRHTYSEEIQNEKCISGFCFPLLRTSENISLVLRGAEKFKYFIFNVYVAGFYSENEIPSLKDVFKIPGDKLLVLYYLRSIPKEDFISSSEKSLRSNPDFDPDDIRNELNALYEAYEDVDVGDSYSLSFKEKESNTCLFKNDVQKVCIKGKQFAEAYFSIWLSENSLDKKFSRKLIKGL